MRSFSEIYSDLEYLQRHLNDSYDRTNKRVEELRKQKQKQSRDLEELEAVSEVMRNLQERLSANSTSFLNEFASNAVQQVFHDTDLSVEISIGDRGTRKTAEIYVLENHDGITVRSPLVRGNGGGVQVIMALVIQALVIYNRGLSRYLFIDEYFTQISDDYVDSLIEMLDTLHKEFGFRTLLITHDRRFIARADKIYTMNKGELTEQKQ